MMGLRGLKLIKIWIVLMMEMKIMIMLVMIDLWIVKEAQGIRC